MTFLFFLLGVANAFEINVDKYKTDSTWYKTPDIIICKDSPVTAMQVYKAGQEWSKKGIPVGHVKKETTGECNDKHETGYILIMGPRNDLDTEKFHAITIRWYDSASTDQNKIVKSAFTEIDPVSIKNRPSDVHKLLSHELGHALGYQHVHIKNDLMIPGIMH